MIVYVTDLEEQSLRLYHVINGIPIYVEKYAVGYSPVSIQMDAEGVVMTILSKGEDGASVLKANVLQKHKKWWRKNWKRIVAIVITVVSYANGVPLSCNPITLICTVGVPI